MSKLSPGGEGGFGDELGIERYGAVSDFNEGSERGETHDAFEGTGSEGMRRSQFDKDGLHIRTHESFARRFSEARRSGRLEPGWDKAGEARPPWKENPLNTEAWRYGDAPEQERLFQEHFAAHGLDDRTLELANFPSGGDPRERENNCAECTRCVAALLNGDAQVARPMRAMRETDESGIEIWGEWPESMEQALDRPGQWDQNFHGRTAMRPSEVTSEIEPEVREGFDALREELLAAGPGFHAAVAVIWKPEQGVGAIDEPVNAGAHWFNVANIDHVIVLIDAQRCDRGELGSEGMDSYQRDAMSVTWIRAEGNA